MNLYRISMQEGTRKALQIFRKALIRINKGKAPTGLNSDPPPLLKVFQINPISFLTTLPCRWHHQIFVFLSVWRCNHLSLGLQATRCGFCVLHGWGKHCIFLKKKKAIKWQKLKSSGVTWVILPTCISCFAFCSIPLLCISTSFFFSCLDLMGIILIPGDKLTPKTGDGLLLCLVCC